MVVQTIQDIYKVWADIQC